MYSSLKKDGHAASGFTVVEILVALSILSLVMASSGAIYLMSMRIWREASARMDAASAASMALTRCTMGAGEGLGLRAAFWPVQVTTNNAGWQVRFSAPAGMTGDALNTNALQYHAANGTLTYQTGAGTPTVIGRGIAVSSVRAQNGSVTLSVRARARVGNTNTVSEMTTTITPRNRS